MKVISLGRFASFLAVNCLVAVTAPAQPPPVQLAFDTVSIKLANASSQRIWKTNPDLNGYTTDAQTTYYTLLTALLPQELWREESIRNLPEWVRNERFAFTCHIAPEQAAAWRDQDLTHPMLRAMLETMLRERFHLQYHTEPTTLSALTLQVAKGAHLTPLATTPSPPSVHLSAEGGGYILPVLPGDETATFQYVGMTMPQIASTLSRTFGFLFIDGTGLQGRYAVTLNRWDSGMSAEERRHASPPEPASQVIFAGSGLSVRRAQAPSRVIVIDHIEKPVLD